MTRIFARPNAAFHAYELSLLRPVSWPPTRHDVPTLWERAKAMFAVACGVIASTAHLARVHLSRKRRGHILARLAPVEKLVRTLLMIEAAAYLLMTPEGRRLRAETPTLTPPAPPPPVGAPKPKGYTTILMPGWQTIAALRPYIDPRVVEREQREALERRLADLESLTADAPATRDASDPASWRCRFSVVHWVHPRPEPEAPRSKGPRPRLLTFDDTNFPIVPGMTVVPPASRAPADDNATADLGAVDLARRIEALSRILANPAPAIRQLARRLAALPADAIEAPVMTRAFPLNWHHGTPENWNACTLAAPAFRALVEVAARKHDPG